MSSDDRTFLDVEDDEQRQRRIRGLFEHLNTLPSSSSASPNPLLNLGRERLPGPVEPPTELLERVQSFLPAISASNEALSRQKPDDVNIEHVSEDESRYIEMNLGLGVFEAKRRHNAEPTLDGTSSESDSDSDSNSDSSSSDSSEDVDDDLDSSSSDDSDSASDSESSVDMKAISSRPIKPLPRRVSQQV